MLLLLLSYLLLLLQSVLLLLLLDGNPGVLPLGGFGEVVHVVQLTGRGPGGFPAGREGSHAPSDAVGSGTASRDVV